MSNKSNPSGNSAPSSPTLRYESEGRLSFTDLALGLIFLANLILIPMAMFAIGEETGAMASIKYLTIGVGASAAAFGVAYVAMKSLAPLHAIGFRLAGALAVGGILLTGAGTSLGSFTGVTYRSVEAKIYQQSGRALSAFIGEANEVALIAERVGPAMADVSDDIARTEICEIQRSCLSRRGNGGRGSMSNALGSWAGQAQGVADALEAGAQTRRELLDDLNHLNTRFQ